jgi:hypothetical protein
MVYAFVVPVWDLLILSSRQTLAFILSGYYIALWEGRSNFFRLVASTAHYGGKLVLFVCPWKRVYYSCLAPEWELPHFIRVRSQHVSCMLSIFSAFNYRKFVMSLWLISIGIHKLKNINKMVRIATPGLQEEYSWYNVNVLAVNHIGWTFLSLGEFYYWIIQFIIVQQENIVICYLCHTIMIIISLSSN